MLTVTRLMGVRIINGVLDCFPTLLLTLPASAVQIMSAVIASAANTSTPVPIYLCAALYIVMVRLLHQAPILGISIEVLILFVVGRRRRVVPASDKSP